MNHHRDKMWPPNHHNTPTREAKVGTYHLHPPHHHRKKACPDRSIPQQLLSQCYHPSNNVTNIFVLSIQITFLCLCFSSSSALERTQTIIHLPLQQFKQPSSVLTPNSLQKDSGLWKRDASMRELKSMQNNLNGFSGDGYYIDVDIGTPPQRMQVLIDTGSANFAVAAENDPHLSKFFDRDVSSTYDEDGSEIYVAYTEGEWSGILGQDVVSFPEALNQSTTSNIAFITSAKKFFLDEGDWQGILGLGYQELSRPDSSVQPFWDSLQEQHPDISDSFSVLLCGSSFMATEQRPLMQGSLILGGTVPSLSKTEIFYTPIYKEWYYEVVLTDIEVAGQSLSMECKEYNLDKTIVDTGTTLIRLPSSVFVQLVDSVDSYLVSKGQGQMDTPNRDFYQGDTVLCFPDLSVAFAVFPVVSFSLLASENSSFRLHLTSQHYLRPVASLEGTEASTCVKFGFAPSSQGTVLGAVLMEAFYVVFDREGSRVGFGQTTCPLPDPAHPVLDVTVEGPVASVYRNLSECAYQRPVSADSEFKLATYIIASMAVIVVLPVLLLLGAWARRAWCGKRGEYQQHRISTSDN